MMDQNPDELLIKKIAKGDRMALQQLFTTYQTPLFRFINSQIRNESLAEEITNETFLDVWRQAGKFEGRASVKTWLFTIGRNKAISVLRKKREYELKDDYADQLVDDGDSPETNLQKVDKAALLRRAVGKLSQDHRIIVDLVYYQEMSLAEAAEILEIATNTAKTRLFYARKKLASSLAKAGIDPGWP